MDHGSQTGLSDPSLNNFASLAENLPDWVGLWLVAAMMLVLLVQAGILWVKAGSVRSNKTFSVSQKIKVNLPVSSLKEDIDTKICQQGDYLNIEELKSLLIASENLPACEVNLASDINLLNRVIQSAINIHAEKVLAETRMYDFETVGNDWLFELDINLKISHISEKFHRVFGNNSTTMIGADYFTLLRVHDTPLEDHQQTLSARKRFTDCRFKVVGLDRVERIFSVSGKPFLGSDNQFVGYRCRATDVTEIDKANSEITYLAHHDFLTGLKNRASFETMAPEMLQSLPDAVIGSIDLDGFKAINDSYGHQTGDVLLKDIAQRMKAVLGTEALLARFGGDEFVFIQPIKEGTESVATATTIGQKLIAELCKPVLVEDRELPIGASLGIALYPEHSKALPDLIRQSDMALYEAKKSGRRQWLLFSQNLEDIARRRKQLTLDMPAALDQNEFFLEFQPQVDVLNRKLNGFETLVRWQHPVFGRVPPNDFIAIAEETGLIVGLGEWILRAACQTASAWPSNHGERYLVSVNVSPVQMFKQDFLSIVKAVLEETGLPPQYLELELTEGALVHNPDEVVQVLTQLRALGVRIAIDDFGTGYSSLSYLQRFPLDRLKVDRSFVKNIADGANDQRIARAIIELGKTLGLNVIAEGVETDEQHDLLGTFGCDDIQGFLHSPPISAMRTLQLVIAANEKDRTVTVIDLDQAMPA